MHGFKICTNCLLNHLFIHLFHLLNFCLMSCLCNDHFLYSDFKTACSCYRPETYYLFIAYFPDIVITKFQTDRNVFIFAGFRYDAFIIFNQNDQKWVENTLLRILEDTHGFKCCVHYRVGACFLNNISNSLEVSHKVIAVVSKNFFTSNWCNHELAQALYKQAKENDNSIIVIRKDDVTYDKLPEALRERSFIDYSNTVERKTWVSKLVKALESSSSEESLGNDNAAIPLYSSKQTNYCTE